MDPVTNAVVPLYNPRQQVWADHFRWSEADLTILEPLSATGRATVALLDLNAPQHRMNRRWLTAVDLHP